MATWSDLPDVIFTEIIKRLYFYEDFIRLQAVCTKWRSVAVTDDNLSKLSTQFPWVVNQQTCESLRLRNGKLHGTDTSSELVDPEPYLASKGWLLTLDETQITLIHPFSLSKISMPVKAGEEPMSGKIVNVSKMVLSCSPSTSGNFIVMIICSNVDGRKFYSNRLACCKNGDSRWTGIGEVQEDFDDITYCNGRLYALHMFHVIHVFKISHHQDPVNLQVLNPGVPTRGTKLVSNRNGFKKMFKSPKTYMIAKSSAALMMVQLQVDVNVQEEFRQVELGIPFSRFRFLLVELSLEKYQKKEVEYLENEAIFLGHGSSAFLRQVDNESRFKANHIYFLELAPYIMARGVYNLQDGRIQLFRSDAPRNFKSSLWIEPAFH